MSNWLNFFRPRAETQPEPAATRVNLSQMESWDDLAYGIGTSVISPERAMRHSAVFACVRIIAGAISSLPFQTYDEARNSAKPHFAIRLLKKRPNPRMSAAMFWRQQVSQMLLRGNAVAWIERKRSGVPVHLWPIPFNRVGIDLVNDRLRYRLVLDDGSQIVADQDDVLHFPGSMEWTGTKAKTPIEVFADSVSIGLEANRYAKQYFDNDATPPSYISYKEQFKNTSGQTEEIRKQYKAKFGGNNRHSGPLVLDQGGVLVQMDIKASDAQLLETRQFSVIDIARIFGVPPHLIGSTEKNTALGSSVEQQNISFVQHTIGPHQVAIEQEINEKIHGESGYFSEYDTNGLLKGDIKARFEAYRLSLGGSSGPGFMTPNEVRRSENQPPIAGGDELVGWVASREQKKDDAGEQTDPTPDQQQTAEQTED